MPYGAPSAAEKLLTCGENTAGFGAHRSPTTVSMTTYDDSCDKRSEAIAAEVIDLTSDSEGDPVPTGSKPWRSPFKNRPLWAVKFSATPDLDDEEFELPSLKELLGFDVTRSPALEIPESQNGQEESGQESAPPTPQEPPDYVFDVFAEGDDNPSRNRQQPLEPATPVFPSSDGVGKLSALPISLQAAISAEADSERETESWDTHGGHIQDMIGERHAATGHECQVVIYTTRWLPRRAVKTKLLRRYRKRQRAEKAIPTRRSLRLKDA